MRAGRLISFEGCEGSGKTTQARCLGEHLRQVGVTFVTAREPGATVLGERLRALLLDPELGGVDPLAESILFAASRAEVVARVLAPALARGEVAVCDRFVDSSRAYQGYGLGVPLGTIEAVNAAATGGLTPDLTVLLDIEPEESHRRTGRRPHDRIEARGPEYHLRVRDGYLRLAAAEPRRFLTLNASQPVDVLARAVAGAVDACLARPPAGARAADPAEEGSA